VPPVWRFVTVSCGVEPARRFVVVPSRCSQSSMPSAVRFSETGVAVVEKLESEPSVESAAADKERLPAAWSLLAYRPVTTTPSPGRIVTV
jgi:hypothetical protein